MIKIVINYELGGQVDLMIEGELFAVGALADAFYANHGETKIDSITINPNAEALEPTREYPYPEGPHMVLGPQIFASEDENTINWKGRNYVPQETT